MHSCSKGARMIDKNKMLPLLVLACPDFNKQWEDFLVEWDELDKPYYIALSDFARHLCDKLNKNEINDFPKIFSTIEDLHIHGTHYVREAVTIGLLESIQNTMLNNDKDPNVFMKFLGNETIKSWNELNKFWDEGKK